MVDLHTIGLKVDGHASGVTELRWAGVRAASSEVTKCATLGAVPRSFASNETLDPVVGILQHKDSRTLSAARTLADVRSHKVTRVLKFAYTNSPPTTTTTATATWQRVNLECNKNHRAFTC